MDIFYRLTVVLCVMLLAFAAFAMIRISRNKESIATLVPSFRNEIQEGHYEDALKIYRQFHDQSSDEPDREEILRQMETIVNERSVTIENKVRFERYELRSDDLKFFNGMGELTYSHLSNWLNSLCEDFLLGNIEKPDVTFIFDEISRVDNIEAVVTPLLREVDSIEQSSGTAQSAERKYGDGDYIAAVKEYKTLLNESEVFVYNFASRRVEEIKKIMYKPMLEQCEHMLDTYQYYSAETILSISLILFLG